MDSIKAKDTLQRIECMINGLKTNLTEDTDYMHMEELPTYDGENVQMDDGARQTLVTEKKSLASVMQQIQQVLNQNEDKQIGCHESGNRPNYKILGKNEIDRMVGTYGEILALVGELRQQLDALPIIGSPIVGEYQKRVQVKGPKQIQLYLPTQNSTMEAFCDAVREFLECQCEIRRTIGALERELPLAVVCPSVSRHEPDIDNAIKELNWTSAFLVLFVHTGTVKSLPAMPTSSKIQKDKYRHMELVDMAFTLESKLYNIEMNDDGKQKIKKFIENKYNVK